MFTWQSGKIVAIHLNNQLTTKQIIEQKLLYYWFIVTIMLLVFNVAISLHRMVLEFRLLTEIIILHGRF